MLEVAVRRLKSIEQDTHDAFNRNKERLSRRSRISTPPRPDSSEADRDRLPVL
jgi:hypothetical protein